MDAIIKPGAGGRPTQDQAAQLSSKILDAAQTLFLAQGFERTSIDQIATAAHVAKRTLYSRFDGKVGVFDAVIKRRIDTNLLEIGVLDVDNLDLEEKLRRLAYVLLDHILDREAIELDRAITAEAARFPNLARLYREHAAPRYTQFIATMLQSSSQYSRSSDQADRDAHTFLILLVLPLLRLALFSTAEQVQAELDGGVIEDRLQFFMKGIQD